ncbi:MAG: hypothetical protein ABI830_15040, partial [Pseudolabrys sp.]
RGAIRNYRRCGTLMPPVSSCHNIAREGVLRKFALWKLPILSAVAAFVIANRASGAQSLLEDSHKR